jgi:beta-lactamase superfamily II metal-dependent hydrolase
MNLTIFNVRHGFCAYLIADTNNVMLFDCGQDDETGFSPSSYLRRTRCTGIEKLVITNFDQDHVSDLPNVVRTVPVTTFSRNRSFSPEQLQAMKLESGPITGAMETAVGLHRDYVQPVSTPPDFGIIEYNPFCNDYPEFTDTNNLSLVSFIHFDGMGIIIPGDLEREGWLRLLQLQQFCDNLSRVNIFVTSHHGRESGYCAEVFQYCSPDIFIISDKEIVHDTQDNVYASHASGVPFNNNSETRYVLTTRSDGSICISKSVGTGYHIQIGV